MAKAGTYAAYQQLNPITTDFGEIAEGIEQKEIARQEREREQDELRRAEQDRIAQNFGADYGSITEVITNTKTLDEAFARGVNGARDMIGQTYKEIQKNPSLANDVTVQLKLQNLRNYSKNLKTVSDRYTEYAKKLGTGIQDGTASSWMNNTLNELDSIFNGANLEIRTNPETGMPIAATIQTNDDGEPVLDKDGQPVVKELNLIEALDGRGLNDIVGRYDMAEQAREIGPKLGKRTVTKPGDSFETIEYQNFSQIEGDVRGLVKGLIGNEKSPTDIAKSIWSDVLGEEATNLTAKDMKRVEDAYVNTIAAFYNDTAKREINYSARTAAQKENRQAAKDAAEQEEKGPGISLRTDEDYNPLTESPVGVSGDIGGGGNSFSLKKPVTIGPKGKEMTVDNLYLTDSGKVVFEADYKVGKAGDIEYTNPDGEVVLVSKDIFKQMTGGGLNTSVLNDIAVQLGLKNAGRLKDELRKVKKDFKKPTQERDKVPTEDSKAKALELINKYR